MTKKQARKLINKYLKWWVANTGLGYHRIVTKFVDHWEGGLDCDALCDSKWQYLDHSITFNLAKMQTMTKEEVEITIVHELMHIFLNEMQTDDLDVKHEERVASSLQKAFMGVKGAK